MNVEITNKTDIDNKYLILIEKITKVALEYEKFTGDGEISLSLVNDSQIHELNLKYRKKDCKTDVLSFRLQDFRAGDYISVLENEYIILGDIVISTQTAISQAKEYGHSLDRELAFLTVHGVLHLLGYDHMNDEDEKEMFLKQNEILNYAGIFR